MKKKEKEFSWRKKCIIFQGIAIVAITAVLLAVQSMTVSGSEKNNGASEQEEVRIRDQSQRYPLLSRCPGGERDDYILLLAPGGISYEEKEEGILWKIVKNSYARIFPAALPVPKTFYVQKQAASRGGFFSLACSYDMPADWVLAYPSWEACLRSVYCPDEPDNHVFVHITENRMFPEGVWDHWEEMQSRIKESAEKTEGVNFSTPVFERYIREDGRELIFYSFICDTGEEKIQFASAYVFGKKYLAEFIGCSPLAEANGKVSADFAIKEITRYMAASFVETEEEKNWASLKWRPYLGFENWAYEDLHNPFAMAAEMYTPWMDPVCDIEDEEIEFESEEWEELIRMAAAYHYDLTGKEREALSDRPLRASELTWITEVEMVESPIPGRDTVSINGLSPANASCTQYPITTLKDIAALPNLEKLTLEIGSATDYEALGECATLKEISIASMEQMREADWINRLPQLESLSLRISNFPHLNELGYVKEGGSTFSTENNSDKEEKVAASDSGAEKSLEEVLAGCKTLKYLELENPDMEDFGFLDELPDLYAFCLSGRDEDDDKTPPRSIFFEEDDYPQVRCLTVDGEWLRNPE